MRTIFWRSHGAIMLNEVKCLVGTENGRQLRGVGRDDADVVETSVNVVLRRRIRVV